MTRAEERETGLEGASGRRQGDTGLQEGGTSGGREDLCLPPPSRGTGGDTFASVLLSQGYEEW